MRTNNRLEDIRRPYLDLLIRKLPFEIVFGGFGVIIFLRGHQSKEVMAGLITAVIAILAMYGRAIWPCESSRSKTFWFIGINIVFWMAIFLIASALGKFVFAITLMAVVLIPLTFVLEWAYQQISGGKPR